MTQSSSENGFKGEIKCIQNSLTTIGNDTSTDNNSLYESVKLSNNILIVSIISSCLCLLVITTLILFKNVRIFDNCRSTRNSILANDNLSKEQIEL